MQKILSAMPINEAVSRVMADVPERRVRQRYPLELSVKFQGTRRHCRLAGVGRTLNISSSGILMSADCSLPVGSHLELSLAWPVLLYGETPLKVVLDGRVLRSNDAISAVVFDRSRPWFRTAGRC